MSAGIGCIVQKLNSRLQTEGRHEKFRMSGGWVVRDGPVHRGRAGRGRDGQVWPQ